MHPSPTSPAGDTPIAASPVNVSSQAHGAVTRALLVTAMISGLAASEAVVSGDGRVALVVDGNGTCIGLRIGAATVPWKPKIPALANGTCIVESKQTAIVHTFRGDATGLVWRQTITNRSEAPQGVGSAFPIQGLDATLARTWQARGLPVDAWLFTQDDIGISLIRHPDEAIWTNNRRLDPGASITFTALIRAHAADWRPAVGALCAAYPAWMDPPNPRVHRIAGGGAYSTSWEVPDPAAAFRMGFRFNWKASYDFPSMGMFVAPSPVPTTTTWKDIRGQENSIAKMGAYATKMRGAGMEAMSYFNITEAGFRIVDPAPPRTTPGDADLWRHPNDWVHHGIRDAVLRNPKTNRLEFTNWEKCVIVDPATPVYRAHLIDQARRQVRDLPDSAGICIDRMDHLARTNHLRSDGLSMGGGAWMMVSWMQVMDDIGPILHQADQVVLGNPIGTYTLAAFRHLDGIYTEYWKEMEACSLLCVRKPLIVWSGPYDDDGMQKLLHHGAWPTCPMPGNDHCAGPDQRKQAMVTDYGPMFDALRGRSWALHARPIACPEIPDAQVNLFTIPGGYLGTVTRAGSATSATVRLPRLPLPAGVTTMRAWSITPGGEWSPVDAHRTGDDWTAVFPVARGCGLVRLHWIWIEPFQTWWTVRPSIDVATTIAGARIHATTDGTEPRETSPAWTASMTPGGSLTVRASVWKDGTRIDQEIQASYTEIP